MAGSEGLYTPPRREVPRSHLLLVDDDPALLEALSGTFQNHLGHFTLDTCDTGIKAIDRVTAKHYDTVISDISMPGMNGLQFLMRVKQIRPLVSVVLISGHADQALVAQAIEAGAADFIAKPIERNALISTVRQTLNLSRLRARLERHEARISRTRHHYMSFVQTLAQSNEKWLATPACVLEVHSGSVPPATLIRQQRAERQMEIFTERATRHLAKLDAFLLKASHTHRQIAEECNIAQEKLRRLAITRLQGR